MVNRASVGNVYAAPQRSHVGVADWAQGYLNWGGLPSGQATRWQEMQAT